MAATCQVWPLERYARLTLEGVSMSSANEWEYFNNSTEKLELSLTKEQIFIHRGRTLLESLSLRNSGTWMRGLSKGDSILIIYKLKNESRRFRMKFSPWKECSAESQCGTCVEQLTKFFPMKKTTSGQEAQQIGCTLDGVRTDPKILEGEVTLGQMAKVVLREEDAQLPTVYRNCSNISSNTLSTVVKLCLADPDFPDFVDQVEKELEGIKQESV